MKLKKLGVALVAIRALGVVMASNAFAARAVTQDVPWTVEKAGSVLSGAESLSSTGSAELVTKVGPTLLEISATGINCLSCTIENSGGSAIGKGILEFTGVKVTTPPTCAVRNVGGTAGIVKTEPLVVEADYMKGVNEEPNYILFKPVAPSTLLAEVELVKGSGSCPIAGKYKVTGEVFVQSVNTTGTLADSQTVESSGAINIAASGLAEPLRFGGVAAELNGTASLALSGTKKGKAFGTN